MSVPAHVIPLRLVQRAGIDVARAIPMLAEQASSWLGVEVESPHPGIRRYLTDLSLPLRGHAPNLTFKKAAYVDLGAVHQTADGCDVEIGWQSSSLAPLFPVFAGRLALTSGQLRLEGFYAPPGGELGVVLDRAFLNIAARGTARWLLERVAETLGSAALAGDEATAGTLTPRAPAAAGAMGDRHA